MIATPDFWRGRRVLLTGHTGFKGAWTAAILTNLGASVTGLALEPEGDPSLWRSFDGQLPIAHAACDLRDRAAVADVCRAASPQLVLHMAAQALVRRSYANPVDTFATNVMGTVHLLDGLRSVDTVEAILVVTSDKVYRNAGDDVAFDEQSRLGGCDPYSASKASAEIAVRSYAESFFDPRAVPVATARGGNVLGGGDFAADRLVPDVFRATCAGVPVILRSPEARRPWQHVLDCVGGYLRYLEYLDRTRAADPPALNFGPLEEEGVTVASVAEVVGRRLGNRRPWEQATTPEPPEKPVLKLDCRRARRVLDWSPRLGIAQTLDWTADWYADYSKGSDSLGLVTSQIERYMRLPA